MLMMSSITRWEHKGFTLVEVMVAMLITLLVMGGVYRTFTTETANTEQEQMLIDMQSGARLILDTIAADIRQAGFQGCEGALAANTLSNSGINDVLQLYTTRGKTTGSSAAADGKSLPVLSVMKGEAGGNLQYLGDPFAYVNDVVADISYPERVYKIGTDALTVRYLSRETSLTAAMGSDTDSLTIGTNDFAKRDILVVTDCEKYSIFQKTNSVGTSSVAHAAGAGFLNNSTSLGHAYDINAKAYELVINTYFVDDETMELSRNERGDDIAENVEDLQFQYLYDSDDDNDLADEGWNDTIPAPFTPDDVAAIRIFILVRSSSEVESYSNKDTYDYPNSPYYSTANPFGSANGSGGAPDDGYYRSLLSTVVYLRNYGL